MRAVFADTFYWIALANRRDAWHDKAKFVSQSPGQVRIVTTDEVLVEFLNYLSAYGPQMRRRAVLLVHSILDDPEIKVIQQTHQSLMSGLELYENRLDKEYSLVDCISMQAMKAQELTEVLTHDKHFFQEGFTLLLTD